MAIANEIQLITKYLPSQADEVLTQESLTERFFGKNAIKVDFLDARTVKVFRMESTGLTNYQRGGHGSTNSKGGVNSTAETFELKQERWAAIPVDGLDNLDDGGFVLGHLAKQFLRRHVVQEFDAYRFSKLAGYTSTTFGNKIEETISANSIIKKFNAGFKWLKNQKVPTEHQIIYVSASTMELIRNTDEINRYLTTVEKKVGDYYTTIERYDSREIIEVPEDEFYTDIVIGDGYYPASTSKIINFMIVDETAPIVVKKLDWVKVYSSDEVNLGYKGYELDELYYHDIFLPDNKRPCVYCSVSAVAADTVANTVLVDAVKGTTTGYTKVANIVTGGIMYDKLYLATAATKPAIGSSTSALTQIYIGTEFQPNASHNYIVASLDGKVAAVSADFTNTLPVA